MREELAVVSLSAFEGPMLVTCKDATEILMAPPEIHYDSDWEKSTSMT